VPSLWLADLPHSRPVGNRAATNSSVLGQHTSQPRWAARTRAVSTSELGGPNRGVDITGGSGFVPMRSVVLW
jgi:hypothetical protein